MDLTRHVELLAAADPETRAAASRGLAAQGARALEVLTEGLSHPDWRVRRGCADLLDHLADDRCAEPLSRALEDPVAAVRRLALHAIGCQSCKPAPLGLDVVARLARLALNDRSIRVRRAAAHQLGCQPPDPRAIEVLAAILENETDPKLRRIALWGLGKHHEPRGALPASAQGGESAGAALPAPRPGAPAGSG